MRLRESPAVRPILWQHSGALLFPEIAMFFEGPTEPDPEQREERLGKQYQTIFEIMSDGVWRSLPELAGEVQRRGVGCPVQCASAQLRHMRKPRFGGHTVNKKFIERGLYVYQLIPNDQPPQQVDYDEYMKSDAWKEKRDQRLGHDRYKCVNCDAGQNLEVHHLTYKRLGDERMNDLVTLCRTCHRAVHIFRVR